MNISKKEDGGIITLAVEGRVDTTTSPQFQEQLIPAFDEAGEVILDMSGLAYISSAGLRVLLLGQKTANGKGITMKLVNVSAEIMEIFNMTGFSDMLTIG